MNPTHSSARLLGIATGLLLALTPQAQAADEPPPAWTQADRRPPMTAAETRTFLNTLARYVYDHHLKQAAHSPQRGMVYEYFDTTRSGQFDQFVQGEALDTMHDGAWLAAALVNAYRATGDPFYQEFLTRWQLPFYCTMLNHSDRLFSTKHNHARPERRQEWTQGKEWRLQEGEKGFVPYWWDDGGSVSLERRRDRNPLPAFPCFDHFVDRGLSNPRFLLDGYSLGSSNHLAQDLGVMLQQAWLLLRESPLEADRKLAAEVAEAAHNLQQCRMRHFGHIPMCDAPAALARGDAALLKFVPDQSGAAVWSPDNHYVSALYQFPPGQRRAFPGFADDQEYRYYFGIARHGGQLPRALAFKTIYDAYTEPLLYRAYSDDAPVPAGINRFDLHPYWAIDGKPLDYRSDRKGPGGRPRPLGSRMGPQNMVCCGWALQALGAYPGIWEERYRRDFRKDLRVYLVDRPPTAAGQRLESPPKAQAVVGPVTVNLESTRTALELRGECPAADVTLKIFSRPDTQGSHATLTLKKDRTWTAVNDRGETLSATVPITVTAGRMTFAVQLPYTIVKAQKAWANGIEHGRYALQVGVATRNFYLASNEDQVRVWLEHELAGGLRTWEAIFRARGYLPTGIGAGEAWDQLSDSGGYAHLMSAAAQWLFCLEGKRDWEVQRVPALLPPK